jgi:hypothetical protein
MVAIRIPLISVSIIFFCKRKRVKFDLTIHNTVNILDYVHADL